MAPAFLNRSIQIFLLLLHIFGQMHRLKCRQTAEFISLACGGNGTYEDPDVKGVSWTSDDRFVDGGNIASVDPPTTSGSSRRFTTIRYFPGNQTKYCYVLPNLVPNSCYLVRTSFWHGTRSMFETAAVGRIRFELLVGADEWATISITWPQHSPLLQEIYVRAIDTTIPVCLAGKGIGLDSPFISTIELRPLKPTLHGCLTVMETQTLIHKEYRIDLGARSNAPVRYPDDEFDRIWEGETAEFSTTISTTNAKSIDNTSPERPPVVVLQTALGDGSVRSFNIILPIDGVEAHQYTYVLYFSEIDTRVNSSGQRVFDIIVNNGIRNTSLVYAEDILQRSGRYGSNDLFLPSNASFEAFGNIAFMFQADTNSTYGPFISGLEILRLSDNPQSTGTVSGDRSAIQDIINALNLMGWAGDPCLPYAYDWLNCSQPPFSVRINALSLSNHGLAGALPPSINNLTELVQILLDQNHLLGGIPNLSNLIHLKVLDLSNNSLSGAIPNFLAAMPNLHTLLLQNNNFSGQVPQSLLQRSMSNPQSFYLDFAGNPLLCNTTTCPAPVIRPQKESTHLAFIIGASAGSLILVAVVVACYALLRARHLSRETPTSSSIPPPQQNVISQSDILEMANPAHNFSYHDIEVATDNFRRKLGEGGFGPVYHGTLRSGAAVAIKVLSDVSRQGAPQFLNEVGILSRVHHKSLVRLVGYCIERKLVLVYEYMSLGALSTSLYGDGIPLDWRTRLKIAVDAAEGLEYLHTGCSPRIIHRDVKSGNILLNHRMEAKIADFGICKFRANETYPLTSTAVVGSRGYLDPEYAHGRVVTVKVDVYSFGVVLFEIISGRPPIFQTPESGPVHIVDNARLLLQQDRIEEMVDDGIRNGCNPLVIQKIVDLAMMCVDPNGNKRPTMRLVCNELKQALQIELQSEQMNDPTIDRTGYTSSSFTITQLAAR